jgi:glycosyltransferase involved in cell wall biosynthesis
MCNVVFETKKFDLVRRRINIVRVLIAVETRFYKTPDGAIWTENQNDYTFWAKYLDVFSKIIVLARVMDVKIKEEKWIISSGSNVIFYCLSSYIGPWDYLRKKWKFRNEVRRAVQQCDVAILRVAGAVASLAWKELRSSSIPFAVEVCGDPWESLKPGTVKNIARPIARVILTYNLKKQCLGAVGGSYVTESTLQQKYPTKKNGYSVAISDVNLPEEAFLKKKKEFNKEHITIINVGSMETLYKAQDVQIKAIKECRDAGLNINLQLVGDGRCKPLYEKLVKEIGAQEYVEFIGKVSDPEEVRNILDNADIFILPSLVEGLPRALVEAMARGLPCVATNVGGIPELLPFNELVEPNDYISLKNKIIEICSNKSKLREMSKRNLERSRDFHLEVLSMKRKEFYNYIKNVAEFKDT